MTAGDEDLASLAPLLTFTGQSLEPASGAVRDFRNPVTYTVTADDDSTVQYTANAIIPAETSKSILSLSFDSIGVQATVSGTNVTASVPYGTDLSDLAPTVVITGQTIQPNSGAGQDFSSPVEYTVEALDGSTKVYTVTVSILAPTYAMVQDVFNDWCTTCHHAGHTLNLLEGGSYANIVNVPSTQTKMYILPGDPANSYLYKKITGSDIAGSTMPIGSTLSADSIHLILEWIDAGAEE